MKNLVLGVAKGYDWYTLEPFVNSWRKNCPSAELVLLADDISDFTRDRLKRGGVSLENFPYAIEGIPNNTRWKIFRDFLDVRADEYEQIFITDTRDVIFQADIFERFKALTNWLGVATEADDIGGSKTGNRINYRWLVDCFGKDAADKLVDKKIICCGTVIGSSHEMKLFCRDLWKILQHYTTEIFDQGVTNYLIYSVQLPIENLIELDVDGGDIFTSALIADNKIRDGFVLRGDDAIPAVVHQYDRHEELIRLVDEIYRDKNFSFDEHFADPRSLLEQCYCLLRTDKIEDATWLFLKVFFSTEDLINYANLLMKIWKFAVKKNHTRSIEILELAIQKALLPVDLEKFSVDQLMIVKNIFVEANKNNHAVDLKLKFSFANRLLRIVKYALEMNVAKVCFFYIDRINELELPPDQNFQRIVDEVERTFGRKDKAVAAY